MKHNAQKKSRRGQIIALAPVMLAVLGGIVAMSTDVGHMLVARARLQNAADAASLAAAQVLVASRNDELTEAEGRDAAEAEALAIQLANWDQAGLGIEFGYRSGETFVAADTDTAATAVRATAFRNDDAPGGRMELLLAGFAGFADMDVEAAGTSAIASNVRGYRGDLSPFAVPEDRMVDPDEQMVFYPGGEEEGNGNGDANGDGGGNGDANGNGGTQTAPGNWGLLNFDGGPNTTPELADWILNGYQGGLEADAETGYIWVEGSPGWRAALEDEMTDRIGDSLIMLIYDQVTGQGSNVNYRIVGFFSATILEVEMHGNNRRLICRVDELRTVHDVLLGGSVPSANLRKIQLVQ